MYYVQKILKRLFYFLLPSYKVEMKKKIMKYKPLSIINCNKWGKKLQTAGYNATRTVEKNSSFEALCYPIKSEELKREHMITKITTF